MDYLVVCLNHMKSFKFTFVKRITDENEYRPIYFNSKTKTIINSDDFMSILRLLVSGYLKAVVGLLVVLMGILLMF